MTKNLPKQVKALLIDFDGTLADSMSALNACYTSFLLDYGIKGEQSEFDALVGPTIPEIVNILREKHKIEKSTQELLMEYRKRVREAYDEKLTFFPGVTSVLEKAKKKQIKLAIVTSGPRNLIESFLERHQMKGYFDVLVTGSDNHLSKPSPEPYQAALGLLQLTADEAVAIEDSIHGIKSASGAELFVIQFRGSRYKEASGWAESWKEVENLLGL